MASSSQSTKDNNKEIIPRWKPNENQLRILEETFRNCGGRSPAPAQIFLLTAHLQQYGVVEPKNIFFWFENRKRKEREGKATPAFIFTNPIFNVSPRAIMAHTADSIVTTPTISGATPASIIKIETIMTPTDHSRSNTVVNLICARGHVGLDQHFQQVRNSMNRIYPNEQFNNMDNVTNDDSTLPLFPVHSSNITGTQFNNDIDAPIDVDMDLELRLGPAPLAEDNN